MRTRSAKQKYKASATAVGARLVQSAPISNKIASQQLNDCKYIQILPLARNMTSSVGAVGRLRPLTGQVRYITQQPDNEEVHGQAISALGVVVCDKSRQLSLGEVGRGSAIVLYFENKGKQ